MNYAISGGKMKKVTLILLLILIVNILYCTETLQRDQDPAPEYFFVANGNGESATFLRTSWWDYNPFGYNGHALNLQPEFTSPMGWLAGGIYLSYHCSDFNSHYEREVWYSYLNQDHTLSVTAPLTESAEFAGYANNSIDQFSADPFFVWHSKSEEDEIYDCKMAYDKFHILGIPGDLSTPVTFIDNPTIGQEMTGHDDDEFIWPIVKVGSSPDDDQRRIHIYANNHKYPNSKMNTIYGYVDVSIDDLSDENPLNWTFQTFPAWDNQQYSSLHKVKKDMLVDDNFVFFFGSYGDTLFCYVSEDFGETFTEYTEEWLFEVDNPLQQDGETYQFYNEDGVTPAELVMQLVKLGSHFNGVYCKSEHKILWMTLTSLNTVEKRENGYILGDYCYPKIFSFDLDTHSFDFYDMDIQDLDPGDDNPATPWDLDEDGLVDNFNEDGSVKIPLSVCSYYIEESSLYNSYYHFTDFKMSNYDNWIVATWFDSKKYHNYLKNDDSYDLWEEQHEIAVSISDDSGETWSEPRYINSNSADNIVDEEQHLDGNYAPELDGMNPVYITLGDRLEPISCEPGNYHAKLHLAFYDDPTYGAAVLQTTSIPMEEGELYYTCFDIEFQEPVNGLDSDENELPFARDRLTNIYPNPFNLSKSDRKSVSTISFSLIEDSNVTIDVFNCKGQRVRTVVDEFYSSGSHSIQWDGKDDSSRDVGSGVYFYRLKSKNGEDVKKMVVLK